jgi:hypothetical protein
MARQRESAKDKTCQPETVNLKSELIFSSIYDFLATVETVSRNMMAVVLFTTYWIS